MWFSEFQEIRSGRYFDPQEHATREAAEAYAVQSLIRLGEDPTDARNAAAAAGYGCADTAVDGFGVRIFEKG